MLTVWGKDGDARLLNLNVKMVSECMLLVYLQERLGSMKQGKIQVRWWRGWLGGGPWRMMGWAQQTAGEVCNRGVSNGGDDCPRCGRGGSKLCYLLIAFLVSLAVLLVGPRADKFDEQSIVMLDKDCEIMSHQKSWMLNKDGEIVSHEYWVEWSEDWGWLGLQLQPDKVRREMKVEGQLLCM